MAGAISKPFSYSSRCFQVRGRTVRKNDGYHRIQTSRTRMRFVAAFILVIMFTLSAGLVTPSSVTAAASITPLNPASGVVGTVVTVSGSGFATTTKIEIYYDGTQVSTTPSYGILATDSSGDFSATFTVPSSVAGPHTVNATDGITFAPATFTVPAHSISLSHTSGPVGTLVTVSGSGFALSPSINPTQYQIFITFWGSWGSTTPLTNIVYTDVNGAFNELNFTVPLSPAGTWTVQATDTISTATATFTVVSSISLSPKSGPVGTLVTVSGSGFTASSFGVTPSITITFNGTVVGSGGSINGSGGFLGVTFTVPASPYGHATVKATDGISTATANFTVAKYTSVTMIVSYSVVGGGSGYTAPGFNYYQNTTAYTFTLSTTPTALQVNTSNSWSVGPNPLTGSTSSERWYAIQALSGTPVNETINFAFYHQYVESFNIPTGSTTTVGSPSFNLSAQVNTQTGSPKVTLASFPANPGSTPSYSLLGKWVDLHLNSAGGVNWVVVRVYFTATDLSNAGLSESNLALYWLYGTLWQQCIGSQVDTTTNSVWMKITSSTSPSLSQLTGTVFTVGPGQNQPVTTTTTTSASPSPTPVYPSPTSTPPFNPSPTTSPGTWKCIIATAAYGSEMAPEVVYMRHVRDNMIGSSQTGRILVNGWNTFYYSWSPPLAQLIASSDALQSTFRVLLLPLVGIIHLTASIYTLTATVNTSFASVIAFLSAAITSTAIYVVTPLFIILQIRKRFHPHF